MDSGSRIGTEQLADILRCQRRTITVTKQTHALVVDGGGRAVVRFYRFGEGWAVVPGTDEVKTFKTFDEAVSVIDDLWPFDADEWGPQETDEHLLARVLERVRREQER